MNGFEEMQLAESYVNSDEVSSDFSFRPRIEKLCGSEIMMISSGEEYFGSILEGTIGGVIDEIGWDFSIANYEGSVHIKITHLNTNKRFISSQSKGSTRFFAGADVNSKIRCSFRAQSKYIRSLKIPLHNISIKKFV